MEATVVHFGLDKFTEFINGELKKTEKGIKYIVIDNVQGLD